MIYQAINRQGQSKCILISERTLSENVTNCMILTICHSRNSKTMDTVKRSVVDIVGKMNGKSAGN